MTERRRDGEREYGLVVIVIVHAAVLVCVCVWCVCACIRAYVCVRVHAQYVQTMCKTRT